jgi:predicted MFS family arabinose efflux permease
MIYSISGAVALIGPLFAGKIVKKAGFRLPLSFLFGLIGILISIIAVSHSIALALSCLFLIGISLASTDVIGDSASHHEFSSKIRASLGSVSSIIGSVAHSIAMFLTGISINILGLEITILICAGFAIITALIYFFGLRK